MPKVSVVMGVYNGARYLKESIDSILAQTFEDFELIVCDDYSQDNSMSILEEYKKLDNRIIVLQNEKNYGLAYSLNKCIDHAKGEYIARMDDDDISLPNRFEKQVAYLDNNPEIAFVCSGRAYFDDNGVWGERIERIELTKANVFKYNPISHPTVMIRKSALQEVGGYTSSELTRRCEDYDLWCKLYKAGYKAGRINEILLKYRESHESHRKRSRKARLNRVKVMHNWRINLKFPITYEIYVMKYLVKCIIPNFVFEAAHRIRFRKSVR